MARNRPEGRKAGRGARAQKFDGGGGVVTLIGNLEALSRDRHVLTVARVREWQKDAAAPIPMRSPAAAVHNEKQVHH